MTDFFGQFFFKFAKLEKNNTQLSDIDFRRLISICLSVATRGGLLRIGAIITYPMCTELGP